MSIIITAAVAAYTLLDTYVFKPDQRRGNAKTIFNHTDFPRLKDKYGRSINSIFTKFNHRGLFYDKAVLFAGYDGTESDWLRWLTPGNYDLIVAQSGGRVKEILHGYVDKNENFNADSIFELFGFFQYWHGGVKAKEIIFHKIINPMYNLGLRSDITPNTNHRFTATDRRFFMPLSDIVILNQLAKAPAGVNNYTVYTNNGKNSHTIDARSTAINLLAVLQQYHYTSGFFVDALSDNNAIIERENFLFNQVVNTQQGGATLPPLTAPVSAAIQNAFQETKSDAAPTPFYTKGLNFLKKNKFYIAYAAAGLIIAFLAFKIFTKNK